MMPPLSSLKTGILVLLGLAVLYGLHRLACWAEDHGHIYYRRKGGTSGALSNAALEVQALLEPSKRYVLEERRRDQTDEEDSGDPPHGRASGTSKGVV